MPSLHGGNTLGFNMEKRDKTTVRTIHIPVHKEKTEDEKRLEKLEKELTRDLNKLRRGY